MTSNRRENKLMKKLILFITTLLIMSMACGCEAIDVGVNTPTKAPTQVPIETPTGSVDETPVPTVTQTGSVSETPTPTQTGSVSETPVPTITPAVTLTLAPTVTPTVAPTVTPTNTPVPTEAPDVWVYQDGIYNLFSSPNIDTSERGYSQAAINDVMALEPYEAYREYLVETTEGIWIEGYTGDAEELVFPSEIDGKPVVCIIMRTREAYGYPNTTVKSVVIPEGVKLVSGTGRFFENLESIEVASSVQFMYSLNSEHMRSVVIKGSDRVYTSDDVAGKTAVEIGSNYRICKFEVKYIDSKTLENVTLPGDITSLEFNASLTYDSNYNICYSVAQGVKGDIIYTTFNIPDGSYTLDCIDNSLTGWGMAFNGYNTGGSMNIGDAASCFEYTDIDFIYYTQFDGHTFKVLADSYSYRISQNGHDYDFSEKNLIKWGGENYKDATKRPTYLPGDGGAYIKDKWVYDEATGTTVEKEVDVKTIDISASHRELAYNPDNGRAYKTTKYTFKNWGCRGEGTYTTYVALGEKGNPHIYAIEGGFGPVEELLIEQGVISKDTELVVEYDDTLPKLREIIPEPKHDYTYEYEVKIDLDNVANDFWLQSYIDWYEEEHAGVSE